MKGHEIKEMFLKPDQTNIDYSYQHHVPDKEIKAILNKWNYDLVNMPKVSLRADGTYWVLDGQHTIRAWAVHEKGAPIKCKVYIGLTWEEEVELFLQQDGVKHNLTTGDKAKAGYNRGDQDIVGPVDAAKLIGITVSFTNTKTVNTTAAIAACKNAYKRLGSQKYTDALAVLKNAWNGDNDGLTAQFINGITELFVTHYAEIDQKRLVNALSKNNPIYYARSAKDMRGSNVAKKYAFVFAQTYNSTKHAQKLAYSA